MRRALNKALWWVAGTQARRTGLPVAVVDSGPEQRRLNLAEQQVTTGVPVLTFSLLQRERTSHVRA